MVSSKGSRGSEFKPEHFQTTFDPGLSQKIKKISARLVKSVPFNQRVD